MRQVDEDLNPLFDDVVGFLALDIGHKTHAAGVVLVARVVEPLALGQSMRQFRVGDGISDSLIGSLRIVSQY